jgi:serine/threonine-protein kinase
VARGLALAHERVILHHDLKPDNVGLTDSGVPTIGDFGLGIAEGAHDSRHRLTVRTVGYMPPEQPLGNEATPRSDLSSLARHGQPEDR